MFQDSVNNLFYFSKYLYKPVMFNEMLAAVFGVMLFTCE